MSWVKNMVPYIIFFVIALTLECIYFYDLEVGEFIFSSDQLFWLSYQEAFNNSFFLRKMDHLGVFNSWQLAVQFWDTIYYLIVYKLKLSFINVERASFFLTLLFSFVVSFIGFRKMNQLFAQKDVVFPILIITLWYCLNPYTLILWHGGIYNMGLSLTYALAPLTLYYFHRSVFTDSDLRLRMISALLLFFSSFVFWLFAVLVFFLGWYSLLFILIKKVAWLKFFKNLCQLLLLYVPLVSIVLFLLLHEYMNNVGDLNVEYGPTFKSQLGGMWYQFLMIFSWGIYNVWTPRTLFPFGQYFLSHWYAVVTTAVYLLIFFGGYISLKEYGFRSFKKLSGWKEFLKSDRNIFFVLFLSLLIIAIFFAKGAQAPFGGIFQYLFDHVPFFSVFRSADHRFGFAVVLSVATLLVYASARLNKYFLIIALSFLMLLQSYPLFTGTAIRGEDIPGEYFDRIIHIPEQYQEVADFLNKKEDASGYVLVLPSVQYGRYILDEDSDEEYVGQDLFPKIINKPFVYISTSTGMSRGSEKSMELLMKQKSYQLLNQFPIRYIILRSDIPCTGECLSIKEQQANKEFRSIFKNKTFSVYELRDSLPMVSAPNALFRMVNPTKFRVNLQNVSQGEVLRLGLSFHKNWKVYLNKKDNLLSCDPKNITSYPSFSVKECIEKKSFFEGDEWRFLFEKSLFDEDHVLDNGYGNAWTINTELLQQQYSGDFYSRNDDGTLNMSLTVYYQPQSWFYFYGLVSLVFLLGIVSYLFVHTERSKRN